MLTYAAGDGGRWSVVVGAPGFAPLDLAAADSVVVFLNGPAGVPGVALPRLALEDADGDRTVGVPLDFGTRVGLDANGSGFLTGSATDLAVSVEYVASLPPDLARPGYPESIRVTFFDEVVSTSTPSIGVPARPAKFTVETVGGLALPFQFSDADGDGTLSRAGETITVLTEAPGVPRPAPDVADPGDLDGRQPARRGRRLPAGGLQRRRRRRPGNVAAPRHRRPGLRPPGRHRRRPDPGRHVRERAGLDRRADGVDRRPRGPRLRRRPRGPGPAERGSRPRPATTPSCCVWTPAPGAAGVLVFRQRPGEPYVRVTPDVVRFDHFFDLDARDGETARYVLRSVQNNGLRPPVQGPDSAPVSATADASRPDPYIDATARLAFDYFWESGNPANGLVPDRVTPSGPSIASMAAVGFGLSAYTVGADRGWITRDQAAERTLATLEFFGLVPPERRAVGHVRLQGVLLPFPGPPVGRASRDQRALDHRHGAPARRRLARGPVLRRRWRRRGPRPCARRPGLAPRGLAVGHQPRPARDAGLEAGGRVSTSATGASAIGPATTRP